MIPEEFRILFEENDIRDVEEYDFDEISLAHAMEAGSLIKPKDGAVHYYRFYHRNWNVPATYDDRRCAMIDDPEYGIVVIQCTKKEGKGAHVLNSIYSYEIKNLQIAGFVMKTIARGDSARLFDYRNCDRMTGVLDPEDLMNVKAVFEKFKANRAIVMETALKFFKFINVGHEHDSSKVKTMIDIEKDRKATTLDIAYSAHAIAKANHIKNEMFWCRYELSNGKPLDYFQTMYKHKVGHHIVNWAPFRFIPGKPVKGVEDVFYRKARFEDYMAATEAKIVGRSIIGNPPIVKLVIFDSVDKATIEDFAVSGKHPKKFVSYLESKYADLTTEESFIPFLEDDLFDI